MKVSITREYAWEMGHALMKHEGKCYNAHGHNYKLEVEVSGAVNQIDGMVWDFGLLDEAIKPFIENELDHKFFYNVEDLRFVPTDSIYPIDGAFAFDKEPTAENLALWIWQRLIGYFGHLYDYQKGSNLRELEVESVTIYETDKSRATVRRS